MIRLLKTKLIRRILCAAAALTVTGTCSALAATGTVTAYSGLNLRTGCGNSCSVITTLAKNTNVEIISAQGEWFYVSVNGQKGYVNGSYLSIEGEATPRRYGLITASAVNMRAEASTASAVVTVVRGGSTVTLLDTTSKWYKVTFEGREGYIYGEYVCLLNGTAAEIDSADTSKYYVNCSAVNFRKAASTGAEIIKTLPCCTVVTLVEQSGDWSKVSFDGKEGYISSQYLSRWDSSMEGLGTQILQKASEYLGTPYRYGGTTTAGFDCSGFTRYVFHAFGITLNRVANDQILNGTGVSKDQLQVGDLVFFSEGNTGTATHVGIYAGNGQFIHSGSAGVTFTSLSSDYYAKYYMCAVRVF